MTPEERAKLRALQIDWTQVRVNGGPPCLAIEEDGGTCCRAARWGGHERPHKFHDYVSVESLVRCLLDALDEAERQRDAMIAARDSLHERASGFRQERDQARADVVATARERDAARAEVERLRACVPNGAELLRAAQGFPPPAPLPDRDALAQVAEVSAALDRRCALARDWPEDFALENGNYMCQCMECRRSFAGYKRRVVCRECWTDHLAKMRTWRPVPADLSAELAAADAADCVVLGAFDMMVLEGFDAVEVHELWVGSRQIMCDIAWGEGKPGLTAICWHPKWPKPQKP